MLYLQEWVKRKWTGVLYAGFDTPIPLVGLQHRMIIEFPKAVRLV